MTVQLTYWTSPFPVDEAVFKLLDQKNNTLAKVTGESCWHPKTLTKRNFYGGFDPDPEPQYVYVRVNENIEVLEHAGGPIFRIIDDPALLKAAVEDKQCY